MRIISANHQYNSGFADDYAAPVAGKVISFSSFTNGISPILGRYFMSFECAADSIGDKATGEVTVRMSVGVYVADINIYYQINSKNVMLLSGQIYIAGE